MVNNEKNKAIIDYQDASIFYKDHQVLAGINLCVLPGEVVFITGKSGSGKTTLLRSLYADAKVKARKARVLSFDLLQIKLSAIPRLRRQLGIVFQDSLLLYDRTIRENLIFVLKATGWKNKKEMEERIKEVAEITGITEHLDKFPYQLSGGEKKRASIARAILNKPTLLIADEPTEQLDVNASHTILKIFAELNKTGLTILITVHQMPILHSFTNPRAFMIEKGQLLPLT